MPRIPLGPDYRSFGTVAHQLEQEAQGRRALQLQGAAQAFRAQATREGQELAERKFEADEQRQAQQMFFRAAELQFRQQQAQQAAQRQERRFLGQEAQQGVQYGITFDPVTKAFRPIEEGDPLFKQRQQFVAERRAGRLTPEVIAARERARIAVQREEGLLETPEERREATRLERIDLERRNLAKTIAGEKRREAGDIRREDRAYARIEANKNLSREDKDRLRLEQVATRIQAQTIRDLTVTDPDTGQKISPTPEAVFEETQRRLQMRQRHIDRLRGRGQPEVTAAPVAAAQPASPAPTPPVAPPVVTPLAPVNAGQPIPGAVPTGRPPFLSADTLELLRNLQGKAATKDLIRQLRREGLTKREVPAVLASFGITL